MTLINYLYKQSNINPKRVAILEIESQISITYEELWDKVFSMSAQLKSLGITEGDRVFLVLKNSIDWVICYLAIINSGAVAVPGKVNSTPSESKWIIKITKPALYIAESSFVNSSLPFDLLNSNERIAILSKKLLSEGSGGTRIHDLRHFYSESSPIAVDKSVFLTEDAVASINFTYKGLGYAVGCEMTHASLIAGCLAYNTTAGFNSKHRYLSLLPYSYFYPLMGCVLSPISTASTNYIYGSTNLNNLGSVINDNQIDVLTGTPYVYSSVMSGGGNVDSYKKVQYAFCGGSYMDAKLGYNFNKAVGVEVRQGYGLSETMPITCNPKVHNRNGSLGKPVHGIDGVQVVIQNDTGILLERGIVGEIAVKSPTMMKRYYNMPAETRNSIRDGWFLTGDMGWIDDDGYLHFSHLKKRIAKVAGNMVDLLEVENQIKKRFNVNRVAAYAVDDNTWGTVVGVDIESSRKIEASDLKRELKFYLSSYKIPRSVRMVS